MGGYSLFKYFIRRTLLTIPTMFLCITIIFFCLRIVPGDPALIILGNQATPEAVKELHKTMGLDAPIWQQYLEFLSDTIQGDFGKSLYSGKSVSQQLFEGIPHTFNLALTSILFACVVGIPLGIVSARKHNTLFDDGLRVTSLIALAAPSFLIGIFLLIAFSVKIPIFPSMGVGEGFLGKLYYLVLPSITIGSGIAAALVRFMSSSMLDEINKDYIRTARAKGIPEKFVFYKHALRNSLIPVVTVIGLNITGLLSGAVIIERIFGRPGLGALALEAIFARDFPVVQGCLILFTFIVVIVNLLVDLSYSLLNPKIHQS